MAFDLKLFALQEGNAWFRSGWSSLVDFYREYQCAVEEYKALYGEESAYQHACFETALAVLARQIADALSVPSQDVSPALREYAYEWCGLPDAPKGLDAWRGQQRSTRG